MSSSTSPGRESKTRTVRTARRHHMALTAVLLAWSPFGKISKDSGAAKDDGKSRAALRRKLNREDKELEQLQKEALLAHVRVRVRVLLCAASSGMLGS